MTTRLIRQLPRLFTLVVLVGAGTYVFVYLYRWQWNRALISGLFFLAAEIAWVGATVVRELRALGARAAAATEVPAERRLHARLGTAAARPARPFAWLRPSAQSGLGVFVPVLLGAGVILSALAFVVERLAGAVAHGTADRTTARGLAELEPAPHGLLGPPHDRSPGAPATPPVGRVGALAGRIVLVGLLALTVGAAVDLLADVTQSRPSPAPAGSAIVVELTIDQRREQPVVDRAEALVAACEPTVGSRPEVTGVWAVDDDRVRIEIEPAASELQRRRFFGCLEDATLSSVSADVTGWATVTREPDGEPGD